MITPSDLPDGWVWTRLGEIANEINPGFPSGKHNKKGRGIPHLRPMNINIKGEIDLSEVKYVQPEDYDPLLKGDVLFNNTNSPKLLGKTAYIKEGTNWAYSNHMTRIRLNASFLNSAWISYALHTLFLSGFFEMRCTHHVNQASINSTFLAEKVFIPLPPLPEQHRIVAKIEELFTKLDAGVSSLEKTKAQLKRYRQAVLKSAMEGRLTEKWREAHKGEMEPASVLLERINKERKRNANGKKGKYKELPPLDTSDLPQLPEGWVWTRLGEITTLGAGNPSPQGEEYFENGAYPFVRVQDMGNLGNNIYIYNTRDHINVKAIKKMKPFPKGSVLFTKSGMSILLNQRAILGRDMYVVSHIGVSIPLGGISTNWLYYWFKTIDFKNLTHATTLPSLQLSKVQEISIPLPPLPEQHKIVEEIERWLSVADEVEKTVEQSLKQAERLRQSILKKAFEGKLVPQDPTDEPASVLLERIKEEKAKRETEKETKRKKERSKEEYKEKRLI